MQVLRMKLRRRMKYLIIFHEKEHFKNIEYFYININVFCSSANIESCSDGLNNGGHRSPIKFFNMHSLVNVSFDQKGVKKNTVA